jgi:hypothetical protein
VRAPVVRLAVAIVGLAAVVLGVATLTPVSHGSKLVSITTTRDPDGGTISMTEVIYDGGEVTSAVLAVLGIALVTFAAWPRRRKAASP